VVILYRPLCAQKALVLFIGVGQFLCLVVEVAVLVAVVAVRCVIYDAFRGKPLVEWCRVQSVG
jgi:hypothetical protein